jgi:hypothetical protein
MWSLISQAFIISLTVSPAIISPAAPGTKAILPGTDRLPVTGVSVLYEFAIFAFIGVSFE